jgi:diguanylate cyclase (GGDEF)-like protein
MLRALAGTGIAAMPCVEINEAAQRMLNRAYTGHPLSLAICDIDKFKAINDAYGHEIGDLVLKKVSEEVQSIAVPAGRLGGEEFAFLIERRADEAIELAEVFRESVDRLPINHGKEMIGVTGSIGVAEWRPADTLDLLMRRADIDFTRPSAWGAIVLSQPTAFP